MTETHETPIHARMEFYTNQSGEIEMTLESLNDMANPAVHFAIWIKDNLARLGEEAKKDYDAKHASPIITDVAPRLRGPDGGPLN